MARYSTVFYACACVALASALGGCGILEKLKPHADAGATAETATAETSATPAAAETPDETPTAASASAAAADAPLAPPGACVDPVKDASKRMTGLGDPTVEDIADLDGDGKKDKTVGFLSMGMNWPYEIYVMRGACGHWVGEINGKGVSVTGLKSKGLKSLSSIIANPCGADCGCVHTETSYYFNGKSYVGGKSKDVPFNPPCDAGKTVAAAAAAAAGPTSAYKVGDKVMVEWKGRTYPAAIIQVTGPNQYKIHYDGYEKSWDEIVGPSRIKSKR